MIVAAVVADRYNARGLVASVSALVGAAGFIGSAALPASAYHVSYDPSFALCSAYTDKHRVDRPGSGVSLWPPPAPSRVFRRCLAGWPGTLSLLL